MHTDIELTEFEDEMRHLHNMCIPFELTDGPYCVMRFLEIIDNLRAKVGQQNLTIDLLVSTIDYLRDAISERDLTIHVWHSATMKDCSSDE